MQKKYAVFAACMVTSLLLLGAACTKSTTAGTNTVSVNDTVQPDGTVIKSDGTIVRPDGTQEKPDGTLIEPDGTTVQPDGTIIQPDGTVINGNKNTTPPANSDPDGIDANLTS